MQRLAYLVSEYPAVSHTFILREVRSLREMDFQIKVASINSVRRPERELAGEEREEVAGTFYVKRAGWRGALAAHLLTLLKRPRAYVRGLWLGLRLGGTDLRKVLYGFFYFVEAVMVGRWMELEQLPHLHVHFASQAAMVGLIAREVFPIEFSFTVHGPDEFYDAPGHRLTEKIGQAGFISCIGYFARSQLMKLSPPSQWDKFEVAPLGVDPEVFAPRPFRAMPDPFEVLCVGRLVPAKGQHVLLASVERLIKAGRRVRLRLVGDGPERKSLEREIASRGLGSHVVLEGAVNQDRIRKMYERADAFVLASFAEGIPVVLMEAMAMEIPCVSTFVGGIPELIRDGVDGLLVPSSDDRALAEAIALLMDNSRARTRLGRAGRRRIVDKYNLMTNVVRLAEIFSARLGEEEKMLINNLERGIWHGVREATR